MKNAPALAKSIESWAREHAWHGKSVAKLKRTHFTYMLNLLVRMESPDDIAMNRAWSALPVAERLSDSGSRIVCELISSYFTSIRSSK